MITNTHRQSQRNAGFSLVELLVVIGIIAILIALLLPALSRARQQSEQLVCCSNIRQLTIANLLYAGDNHSLCVLAAADIFNELPGEGAQAGYYRWHGVRSAANEPFDPARGPLAAYLGPTGRVKNCPSFDPSQGIATGNNFEAGCGGYGYNGTYIGGRYDLYPQLPDACTHAAKICQMLHASNTVMFTDAGIAQPVGSAAVVAEYSFCEPPWSQITAGAAKPPDDFNPAPYPSIHFRHHGRANVAWADGHVTAEGMTFSNESYGLTTAQVKAAGVGWFGPFSNALFQVVK